MNELYWLLTWTVGIIMVILLLGVSIDWLQEDNYDDYAYKQARKKQKMSERSHPTMLGCGCSCFLWIIIICVVIGLVRWYF